MSTTFGILRINVDHDKLVDEDGELLEYISENIFEPIFFRSRTRCRWLNSIAKHVSDDTRVYALDNTAQGIYTIKDVKELLERDESLTDTIRLTIDNINVTN